MTTRLRLVAAAFSITLIAAIFSSEAVAQREFFRGFDEDLFLSGGPTVRARWFDRSLDAGANAVRIGISWGGVASEHPPADPRNPADPSYEFDSIDSAVRDASARGLRVLITVNGAPNWAEGRRRPASAVNGSWKPRPGAFADFGEALARRYSGSFFAPSGPLPEVRYFEAWNEPNQASFLAPQWVNRKPFAPNHYRRLLNAFYSRVKRINPSAVIVGPGTSPYGDRSRHGKRMGPMRFFRALFCLQGQKRPRPSCSRTTHLDVVSHHPVNPLGSPASRSHPDDLVISGMNRLRKVVRVAQRAGNLRPRQPTRLWVTELWWLVKSRPGGPHGVSPRKQARYIQRSLYLLWRNKVRTVIWFQLTDAGERRFRSGLFERNGKPRPGLTAFRFPLVLRHRSARSHVAWGIPPVTDRVSIQRKRRRGWKTIKVVRGRRGVPFKTRIRAVGGARLRASAGGARSLSWQVRP